MTTTALELPELASNQSQPDVTVNDALDIADAALGGEVTINFASDANLSIGTTGVPAQWQYATIIMTDTGALLTAGRDVIWPAKARRGLITFRNATAHILTVKRAGQPGVPVSAGATILLRDNGTDIVAPIAASGVDSSSVSNLSSVPGSTVTQALDALVGAQTYVGSATVTGSPATTLTLAGLNLSAISSYVVEIEADNASATAGYVSIYVSGDTTPTNYYSQQLSGANASAQASRSNNSNLFYLYSSETASVQCKITLDRKGRASIASRSVEAGSAPVVRHAVVKQTIAGNVTSISLVSAVTGALAVGTKMKVWAVA